MCFIFNDIGLFIKPTNFGDENNNTHYFKIKFVHFNILLITVASCFYYVTEYGQHFCSTAKCNRATLQQIIATACTRVQQLLSLTLIQLIEL